MNKRQFKKMIVQMRKESEINLLTLNDAVINEMEKMTQKIRNKNYPDKKTFYHDNPKYHIIKKQINSGIKNLKKSKNKQ